MIPQAIERAFRRTGIEGPYGEHFMWPRHGDWVHTHYCLVTDHRWECADAPCLRYDAAPCPEHR